MKAWAVISDIADYRIHAYTNKELAQSKRDELEGYIVEQYKPTYKYSVVPCEIVYKVTKK